MSTAADAFAAVKTPRYNRWMHVLGSVVLVVYAVLMIAGGIIGFRAAGSRPSLVAGVISGVLLFGAFAWSRSYPRPGFYSATFIALLLCAVFAIRVARTRRFIPSGMMLAISIAAAVLLALAGFMAV